MLIETFAEKLLYTEQVGIREHDAGTYDAVVINDLYTFILQLLIQLVGITFYLSIVGTNSAEVYLPRCNSHRPDRTIIIVMCFANRSGKSADTDTVASHQWILCFAVAVDISHIHGLCIFSAELEDVSHLNTTGYGNRGFAAMRTDAALLNLGKIVVFCAFDIAAHILLLIHFLR